MRDADVQCTKAWHRIDLQDILPIPLLIVDSDLADRPDGFPIDISAVRWICGKSSQQ